MPATLSLWTYRTRLARVVDGDTVDLFCDLGFQIVRRQRFRLARVDAPERYTPGGPPATAFVENWLTADGEWPFTVRSVKAADYDKYGRFIAEVLKGDANLSDDLVAAGHAVYREY